MGNGGGGGMGGGTEPLEKNWWVKIPYGVVFFNEGIIITIVIIILIKKTLIRDFKLNSQS